MFLFSNILKSKFSSYIKIIIVFFLISLFTYTYYFSLNNIINLWTFSEVHINYSLGFSKRGLLGSIMLSLEVIGISKNKFFSSIYYLMTLGNIFLFLNLINRSKKNNIFFFIFFSLNPALLLFTFYDLGGYARNEIFGIFISLLHAYFAQKFYYKKIKYEKYLKLLFIIIIPLSLITILIHELNILFLSFHFLTTLLIVYKKKFNKITNYKYLITLNILLIIFVVFLLVTNPFTEEFAQELYNNLPNKKGTSFWIWSSIAGTFSEKINVEINHMLNPSGAITLYIFIFVFYVAPIFFLLVNTSKKHKFYLIYILISVLPFTFLFFIGRDWGRWIHIIIFVIFLCLIQFQEKKFKISKNWRNKILTYIFLIFIIFQFGFTRIPHCCNLIKLKLNIFGGIVPKILVFYKISNENYPVEKRFQKY